MSSLTCKVVVDVAGVIRGVWLVVGVLPGSIDHELCGRRVSSQAMMM